jgi:hypothetical protein
MPKSKLIIELLGTYMSPVVKFSEESVKFGEASIGLEAWTLCNDARLDIGLNDIIEGVAQLHEPTARHLGETRNIVAAIMAAEVVDFDRDTQIEVIQAASAHDCGKLLVADTELIDKPGRLDASEWDLIMRHPRAGANQLFNAGYYNLAPYAFLHHRLQPRWYEDETSSNSYLARFDISPKDLLADDKKIWVGTLIIAAADVASALYKKDRPYLGDDFDLEAEELVPLIRANFIEAGFVRKLGFVSLLDETLDVIQEVVMNQHSREKK